MLFQGFSSFFEYSSKILNYLYSTYIYVVKFNQIYLFFMILMENMHLHNYLKVIFNLFKWLHPPSKNKK